MSRMRELYAINPAAHGFGDILAREGPGDYRPGTGEDSRGSGRNGTGRAREGARYHNPVPVIRDMDHRAHQSHRYVAKRNGLPEPVTYRHRAPGWEDRAKRAGLDLAAIAAADHGIK